MNESHEGYIVYATCNAAPVEHRVTPSSSRAALLNNIKIVAVHRGRQKLGPGPVGLWILGTSQFNFWTSGFWISDLRGIISHQAHHCPHQYTIF